jgi:UDP-N-acetylglucosamine 2-epimerase
MMSRCSEISLEKFVRLKVMTIVGTRPEIIKLSRVIAELDKQCNHVLVHTGQNYDYELNEIFFKELEIKKPDYFLEAAVGNPAQDIGNIISRIDPVLEKEKPDAVLFYGDTNSTLAVISAKRRQIPVFHMEAGNRCFDQRVPEELNRKVLDHLSDINLTISEHARRYLLAEGLRPETVMKIGSSMKEVYDYHAKDIEASTVLTQLQLKPQDYFLISAHREDNVDTKKNLLNLVNTLLAIRKKYNKRIIFSTHPRTRKRLETFLDAKALAEFNRDIEFLKPFGFLDYIKLTKNAFCVLSDSGSITEDSSLLGFPAVTIREMHERPEGMDVGTLIMTGLGKERVIQGIDVVTNHYAQNHRFEIAPDYLVSDVSKKVVRIIMSYVDYVNRTVWSKNVEEKKTPEEIRSEATL